MKPCDFLFLRALGFFEFFSRLLRLRLCSSLSLSLETRRNKRIPFTIIAALVVAHPASCATASAPLVKFPENKEERETGREAMNEIKGASLSLFSRGERRKKHEGGQKKRIEPLTGRVQVRVPSKPVDPLHDDLFPRLVDNEAVPGGEEGGLRGRGGGEGGCREFFFTFGFFQRWAKREEGGKKERCSFFHPPP